MRALSVTSRVLRAVLTVTGAATLIVVAAGVVWLWRDARAVRAADDDLDERFGLDARYRDLLAEEDSR